MDLWKIPVFCVQIITFLSKDVFLHQEHVFETEGYVL